MSPTHEKFDQWNELKKTVHDSDFRPFFKERDVWWASIGFNIGDETYGRNYYFERPVLILKKFNNNIFLGVPLSSKLKGGRYYCEVCLNGQPRSAMVSQLRILDSKRIIRKVGFIDQISFEKVTASIMDYLN